MQKLAVEPTKSLAEFGSENAQRASAEQEIRRSARFDEGRDLEFKESARVNKHTRQHDDAILYSAVKTVAAFLNTEGGSMLLGVANDGSIVGVDATSRSRREVWIPTSSISGMSSAAGSGARPSRPVYELSLWRSTM